MTPAVESLVWCELHSKETRVKTVAAGVEYRQCGCSAVVGAPPEVAECANCETEFDPRAPGAAQLTCATCVRARGGA